MKIAALIGLGLALASCAEIRVHRVSQPVSVTGKTEIDQKILALGAFNLNPPIDLSAVCPHGWESVSTDTTVIQGLLHAITLNLYGPWRARIECSAPPPPPKSDDDD